MSYKRNIQIMNELKCPAVKEIVGPNEAVLCPEIDRLRNLISKATKRFSLPIKKIRGDGFVELMDELRKIKQTN